jgi:hypothetical protein
LTDPTLPYLLAQLRADPRTKGLPVLLAAVPDSAEARDVLRRYREDKVRLDDIETRAQGYRDKRRRLQTDFEAALARMEENLHIIERASMGDQESAIPKEKRDELIKQRRAEIEDLKDLHASNLKELKLRFPEAAALDEEGKKLEERLKLLARQFELESARRQDALRRSYERDRALQVVSAGVLNDAPALQASLRLGELEAAVPLTPEEAKQAAEKAMRYLDRMARGDLPGYSVGPAADAVFSALRANKLSPDGLKSALDFVARQPGARAQEALANVVVDANYAPEVRDAAARELIRHLQQYGVVLPAVSVQGLQKLYADEKEGTPFKALLGQLQGSLRPDARTTGERLLKTPLPETPPKPKDK